MSTHPNPLIPGPGEALDPATPLLAERLARAITLGGPIPVAQFMAAANAHYYATRDPLGAGGDFTTAPEISQMFGELIGLWAVELWNRAGRPDVVWVELGPGRGTLTVDALRAMRASPTPPVHFVETSPVMRAEQAKRAPDAVWHDGVETLPTDRPLIVVANEFFDALPVRQLVKGGDGWRERLVACQDLLFLPVAGKAVPDTIIPAPLRAAPAGSVIETSPASVNVMRALATRIVAQGGAVLAIDYGYEGPAVGDTLQAVRGHAWVNPFEEPGERDLTCHVDFATLAAAAQAAGCAAWGPVGQGAWLTALGIDARAAALGPEVAADRVRLVDDMGALFRVLAVTARGWPRPEGFCMTVSYRDATPADLAAVDALWRTSFTATFGHLYDPADLAAFLGTFAPAEAAGALARPDVAIRLAEEDGALIGFAKVGDVTLPVTPAGPALELRQLYLSDAAKGRGVGDALTVWVVEQARLRGAGEIFLSVYVDNHRAKAFYARHGFEDAGPYIFMVGNHRDEDRLMRLAL